eukprot:1394476-Amorphochlora_amoeboformis.AAC.1
MPPAHRDPAAKQHAAVVAPLLPPPGAAIRSTSALSFARARLKTPSSRCRTGSYSPSCCAASAQLDEVSY